MAPLAQRLEGARRVSSHPRIIVTALEDRLSTRYTADTLNALRRHYPVMRFVWLMGADNLSQMRHWQDWRHIAALMPIAVLDRPGYSLKASSSLVAQALRPYRVAQSQAAALAARQAPAFVFLKTKLNPLSATAIRAKRKA